MSDLERTALVVVDVQRAFEDAGYWGRRNNPDCEANVAALLAAWRAAERPVVFVRHDSDEPASPLRPGEPGNAFRPELTGEPDLLVTKQVNSAFHGDPDLAAWLHEHRLGGSASAGSRPTTASRRRRASAPTSASTSSSCSTRRTRSSAPGRTASS